MKKRIRALIENHEECLENGCNVILLDCGTKDVIVDDITNIIMRDYLVEFLEYIHKSNDRHNEVSSIQFVDEWISKK